MSYVYPGRPSELPDTTIQQIELLYRHHVPAVQIASKFQLSRQRVYYYFKKWALEGVSRLPKPSIDDILFAKSIDTTGAAIE